MTIWEHFSPLTAHQGYRRSETSMSAEETGGKQDFCNLAEVALYLSSGGLEGKKKSVLHIILGQKYQGCSQLMNPIYFYTLGCGLSKENTHQPAVLLPNDLCTQPLTCRLDSTSESKKGA